MKYILGAGIAGLIYAYYNKDFVIISPEVGGQMKSNFNLGPRYLHDTSYSRRFLNDLNCPIEKSKIKVGYLSDEGFVNPDLQFRQKYFMKSRNSTSLEGFDESVMNSNKNEFDILKVDFNGIISVLKNEIGDRFINDSVNDIDYVKNIIGLKSGKYLEFDKVVSTVPIKFLNPYIKPYNFKIDFNSYDITYVYTNMFESIEDFDYVYDIRSTTSYHRITKENDGLVLDFFGSINENSNELNNIREYIRTVKTIKGSQIISTDEIHNLADVKFIGRYGTWNRSWKTEKVIEVAIEDSKNE